MACQVASATASLRDVLKAGPLCRQRILDPKKISAIALNSTRPERETSLILYRGAVVMPRCSSKARSLLARIRDLALKDSTSSASRYNFSGSVSLGGSCSSSVLSSVLGSSGCCSSTGSQEPLALSRRVPPLELPLVVCRAGIPEAAAHSELPADRQVDDRCSCVRCGGYEPSNI
jgi:hypothetical protein